MENSSYYTIIGAFVVLTVVSILTFFFWIHNRNAHTQSHTYVSYFSSSVAGLSLGSPVKYKGILVGSVTAIEISPLDVDEICVQMSIGTTTPVTEGMAASTEMAGITGESFIQLSGALRGAPAIKPPKGEKYGIIPSQDSSLQEIFKTTPELLTHADEVVERLLHFLTPENQASVGAILKNTAYLTKELRSTPNNMNQLIQKAHSTLETFDRTMKSVEALSDALSAVIAENRDDLKVFTHEGLYNLNDFVVTFKETLGNLDGFLKTVMNEVRALFPAPAQKTYKLL